MSLYNGLNKIDELYSGGVKIGKLYYGSTLIYESSVVLTINPNPSNAIVTFNDVGVVEGNTIRVKKGTIVNYTVTNLGNYPVSGQVNVYNNQTLNVYLPTQYYTEGQTLFESSTPGTTTLNILDSGKFEIYCIGGGAGLACDMYSEPSFSGGHMSTRTAFCASAGGSGSGFIGVVELSANNYNITIGAGGSSRYYEWGEAGGNSSFDNLITAYGATGGRANPSSLRVSYGGSAPTINIPIISSTLNRAGNNGGTSRSGVAASCGASVYNGYGKGGANVNDNGVSGYIKIIFIGK